MIWKFLIEGPWIVFMAYWVIAALKTQRTQRRESFGWRYGIMLTEIIGFVLVFDGDADIGVLGRRVFHHNYDIALAGIVLVWTGIALAIWARRHLGRYWSGRITIKEDHKLIRTGPYARFRHPIYSGLDLAVIGSALVIDQWRCVAGVSVIILGFTIKAKREESMLNAQFGAAFDEHRGHTGFLLPRFWSSRHA